MTNYTFHNPTRIYFGPEEIVNLGKEIKTYGSKVLLIYGGGSIKHNGIYEQITGILKDNGIEFFECGGIEPNPKHTSVNRGAQICKDNNIEAVLAVGGGSTIDASKAIAQAAFYDGDCWDLMTGKAAMNKALPIFAVTTIAAAGAENDAWTVVSNTEQNMKVSPWSELYQVKAAFVNAEYMKSVSAYQTAAGSVDILSHVTDCRYFIKEHKISIISECMEAMARNVIKYAPIAIADPQNTEARENLAWINTYITGGIMDVGSSTSMVLHMMEHEISAYYDINHGHGIGILMPHWMEYVLDEETAPTFHRFGIQCLNVDPLISDMEGARATIEALKDWLFNKLRLKSKLSELGVTDEHFHDMAVEACSFGVGGKLLGLKDLSVEDVENIYKASL